MRLCFSCTFSRLVIGLLIAGFLSNINAASPRYAEAGVVELSGGASFSYNSYFAAAPNPGYSESQFHLLPGVDYFFRDQLHVGLNPGLRFTYISYEMSTPSVRRVFSVAPMITMGYTIPVNEMLFFDLSFGAGFSYIAASNFFATGFDDELSLRLLPSMKWQFGNTLISCGLSLGYAKNTRRGFDSIQSAISTGISFFF